MSGIPEHPDWCDPELCAAGQLDSCHRSAVHRIDADLPGDVGIAVQLVSGADDPVAEAPVRVELRMVRSLGVSVEGYDLSPGAVAELHAVFGRLMSAFRVDG